MGGLTIAVSILTIIVSSAIHSAQMKADATPFTVVTHTSYFKEDGLLTRTAVALDAMQSDGSHVHVTPFVDKEVVNRKVIVDFSSQQRIGVDPLTESTTTYPLTEGGVELMRTKLTFCTTDPDLERDELLGYEVVKVTAEEVLANGQVIRRDQWLAPVLGCYPLHGISSLFAPDGTLTAETITEALTVIPGDPDPSLFTFPAEYAELSPSEVFAEAALRTGEPASSEAAASLLDEVYHDRRAAQ
jgi:hypothetical protein